MANKIKIVLFGATGRMGLAIVDVVNELTGVEVIGGIAGPGDEHLGASISGVQNTITDTWDDSFNDADVIIDFSTPTGAKAALDAAEDRSIPLLLCTTGLDDEILEEISRTSKKVPLIQASNTSIGVNVMLKLVSAAAKALPGYDAEIVEIHHKRKKDAPSGTALSIGEALASARGDKLSEVLTVGRNGVNLSYENGEIGVSAVRGGDVVGEHTVYFIGQHDRIEITHRAVDRRLFAEGAVRAAEWLVQKNLAGKTGLFSMLDVVG